MIEDKNIPHVLNQSRPTLGVDEKSSIWDIVEANIPPAQPILSPYSFNILNKKYIMAPLALLLAVVLGGGATAYASDSAKPGDALYPVERLVENVQLGLTFSPEAKEELIVELTQERLEELREIIDEEVSVSPSNSQGDVATATSSTATTSDVTLDDLEIEARVFTDTTVVKLDLGGKKFYFETDVRTLQEVTDEIIVRFPILSEVLTDTTTESDFLSFKIVERESRPNDRGIVLISSEGEDRISTAVDALLSFLDHTEADEDLKDIAVASLTTVVDGVTTEVEAVRDEDRLRISDEDDRVVITIDDEGNSTVEVRSENGHVKVEDHAGEVKVEKEKDNDDDVINSASSALSIDAVSYTDVTVITVAFVVDEFTFTTPATSTDAIVSEVQAKFPALTIDDIKAVLVTSVVDTASTPDDRGEIVSSHVDDDDEDEDEEEDEEEYDDEKGSEHQKDEDLDDEKSKHKLYGDDDDDDDDDDDEEDDDDDDD
jgi:hypothetical protein